MKKNSQQGNLLSFLSPSKGPDKSEESSGSTDSFVFKPESEDSCGVIERKKIKKKEESSSDISSFTDSSENEILKEKKIISKKENKKNNSENFTISKKENSINETNNSEEIKTPISDKKIERYSFLNEIRDKNGIKPGETGYDPTTLYISDKDFKKMTEFEKQFWEIKKTCFDVIVFFKKGKFYELYEEDAEIGSKLFDLKVTERVNMKMAGFPEKSYEYWADKFVEQGYKIARVDQAENMVGKNLREKDCKKKEKIIRRELKEIITPGTLYKANDFNCNFLASFYFSSRIGIVLYEATFNKLYFHIEKEALKIKDLFVKYGIKEVLYELNAKSEIINSEKLFCGLKGQLIENTNISKLSDSDYEEIKEIALQIKSTEEYQSFINLYFYMKNLKRSSFLETVKVVNLEENEDSIKLDGTLIKSIELLSNNYDNTAKKSFFNEINFCVTPGGQRLLKKLMLNPSRSINEILERQNRTKELIKKDFFNERENLKKIGDLERLFGKICTPNPNSKDLLLLINGLTNSLLLQNKTIYDQINAILNDFNANFYIEDEDFYPQSNSNDELIKLKEIESKIYEDLSNYLKKEKKQLNCEINYKNIGKDIFQLEILGTINVPKNYILISQTKSHKRYYTLKLKELIKNYVENEEMIFQSKGNLLRRIIAWIMKYKEIIDSVCKTINLMDVEFSYAMFAKTNSLVFPVFSEEFEIRNLRNPIYKNFVSTDVVLKDNNILVLTGPNMGGKSTLMRSICYNVILAQMGLPVFAYFYSCKIFDHIFSRIGASDNLEKGESTFFVELNETNKILATATPNSFIIMDELGRGTCVKDGQAIATAVLNYLKEKKVTLIFSTHYFKIVNDIYGVNKAFMDVEVCGNEVVFKYKLKQGVASDSHGISVAKIAKLPEEIIKKALFYRKILGNK